MILPTEHNVEKTRSASSLRQVELLGMIIHAIPFDQALDELVNLAQGCRATYAVTVNVDHMVRFHRCPDVRPLYTHADLVVADGMPLVWASRLLRKPLPERVTGSDLFPALCNRAADTGLSVFLLGGAPGTAKEAARILRDRYPRLRVAGTCCPDYGFERDPAKAQHVVDVVRDANPDILFVGLGAPKQENWIVTNRQACGAKLCIGIGISFSFACGHVTRAPRWMQRVGLEWTHRLIQEPRRLWKRYLVDDAYFLVLVLRDFLQPNGGPRHPSDAGNRPVSPRSGVDA